MKKFFIPITVLMAALILFVGDRTMKGRSLDAESRAYVEATLPALLSNFTPGNFVHYMAPEDIAHLDRASMEKFCAQMREKLGQYISHDQIDGNVTTANTASGESVLARYTAKTHFEKGSQSTEITIRKVNGAWVLLRVNIVATTS